MTNVPTLYHGSTAGWLMDSGLAIQSSPFGEYSAPRNFIYLADKFEAAATAARDNYRLATSRIRRGELSLSSYVYDGKEVPVAPYVYKLEFDAVSFVDWQAESLTRQQLS